MKVTKNTFIKKALENEPESKGYASLFEALHRSPTTVFISENPKAPALLIEEFRKTEARPILKAAYIDSAVFLGDEQLVPLTKLKSKDEMIGEIIGLLQSPAERIASPVDRYGRQIGRYRQTSKKEQVNWVSRVSVLLNNVQYHIPTPALNSLQVRTIARLRKYNLKTPQKISKEKHFTLFAQHNLNYCYNGGFSESAC